MTGSLITYTQTDLSRAADRVVKLAQSRDHLSKPMVLKIFAEMIFGPKSDWGAVTGSEKDHVYSQRATAQLQQAMSATLEKASAMTPRAMMTSIAMASYKESIALMLQAPISRAILTAKHRSDGIEAAQEAAAQRGFEVVIHDFSASPEARVEECFTYDSRRISLKRDYKPSGEPKTLTVYTGLAALGELELDALMRTSLSLANDGSEGAILLVDDAEDSIVPKLQSTRPDHFNRFVTLPYAPANSDPVHGLAARGPAQASSRHPIEKFLASPNAVCVVATSVGRSVLVDTSHHATAAGRANIVTHGANIFEDVIRLENGEASFTEGFAPAARADTLTLYFGTDSWNAEQMDFLIEAAIDAGKTGSKIMIIRDTDLSSTHDLVRELQKRQDEVSFVVLSMPLNQNKMGTSIERLLSRFDRLHQAPKPEGHTVKITGRKSGDEINIWLRDEEAWGLCSLDMNLTRSDVAAIEDFLANPSKPVKIQDHIQFRFENGQIDIEGIGSAYQDHFTNVHIDDIRLAIAPFLRNRVDVEALIAAQRHRLAMASENKAS